MTASGASLRRSVSPGDDLCDEKSSGETVRDTATKEEVGVEIPPGRDTTDAGPAKAPHSFTEGDI